MSAQGESNHSPEIQWQSASPERWVRPGDNPNIVQPPQSSRQSLKELIQTNGEAPRFISPEERDARHKLAAIRQIGDYVDEMRYTAQYGPAIAPQQQPQPGEVIDMGQFGVDSQQSYVREVFDGEAA